jgi:ribosomal protein S18 acetylase RimI-like enzyme
MPVSYSQMTIFDYDEVVALWQASDGIGEAETREEIDVFLARNPGFSYIARKDSELAGAILCGHDGRRGYLYHLAVDTRFRNQGIGRALVEQCLARLAKVNIPRCSVHLYVDNDSGESFWKQIGWRKRVDLKVMAIDLPTTS